MKFWTDFSQANGSQYLATINLPKEYWQLLLDPKTQLKLVPSLFCVTFHIKHVLTAFQHSGDLTGVE